MSSSMPNRPAALIADDRDLLDPLRWASDDDLTILRDLILEKGGFTEQLTVQPGYQKWKDTPSRYYREIALELQRYGGNSIANAFRGGRGVRWSEVVGDVARKLKVEPGEDVAETERRLLGKVLQDAWEELSEEDRKQLLSVAHGGNVPAGGATLAGLIVAIQSSGFLAYQVAVIVANAVAKAVLGRGLTLAANAALTRGLAALAGPLGMAVAGLWLAVDLASPAFRVTMPAVIHVAYLRLKYVRECPNGHAVRAGTAVCPKCGAACAEQEEP